GGELLGVERAEGEEDDEEGEEEGDHVGIGQQPPVHARAPAGPPTTTSSSAGGAAAPLVGGHAASAPLVGGHAASAPLVGGHAASIRRSPLPDRRSVAGRNVSILIRTIRLDPPAWMVSSPSSCISLTCTSATLIRLSLLATGRNSRFADSTPHRVAVNADPMAGPRAPGRSSCDRTCTSPITVPRMPSVGASPAKSKNNFAPSWCRRSMASISLPRMSRIS